MNEWWEPTAKYRAISLGVLDLKQFEKQWPIDQQLQYEWYMRIDLKFILSEFKLTWRAGRVEILNESRKSWRPVTLKGPKIEWSKKQHHWVVNTLFASFCLMFVLLLYRSIIYWSLSSNSKYRLQQRFSTRAAAIHQFLLSNYWIDYFLTLGCMAYQYLHSSMGGVLKDPNWNQCIFAMTLGYFFHFG